MAKPKENTERVSFFTTKEILEDLKQKASEKGLNVSALTRMIVIEWLKINNK